jgi:diketogulonate reductase-like aldo/keto reductase
MHDSNPQRREILGALIGASLASAIPAAAQTRSGGMLYRTLGRTGERVSAIGLGGYHMGVPEAEQDAIKLVRTAVDQGITFLDNCWDYHDGKSEVWMGKALRDGYRQKVFLMTKFDGRTKESTARQIDESLQRLQTDRVDLMQYHENIRMEDPDRCWRPRRPARSAISALLATKTPPCICACSRWPHRTDSISTPRRCP